MSSMEKVVSRSGKPVLMRLDTGALGTLLGPKSEGGVCPLSRLQSSSNAQRQAQGEARRGPHVRRASTFQRIAVRSPLAIRKRPGITRRAVGPSGVERTRGWCGHLNAVPGGEIRLSEVLAEPRGDGSRPVSLPRVARRFRQRIGPEALLTLTEQTLR